MPSPPRLHPGRRRQVGTDGAWARRCLAVLLTLLASACGDAPTAPAPEPEPLEVPAIAREFRGMWVATVANIDWPSRSGLTVAQQQTELLALLEVAREARLNAVVLQVRAAGDALFPSTLEPWSRSFTGTQGQDPGWDPLAFAIAESHRRGLELHAWFNPFRAGNLSDTLRLAAAHLGVRRPDLMRRSCGQLWFDPGEPETQDHALAVITDVVRRYDVDAVHLDDYFYPYPSGGCTAATFPDSAAYARHLAAGGTLARDAWRRDNIDRFIERLYRDVHAAAPLVRVGVSPFGIWRPGNPAGIVGLDSYATIYADSRKWLQSGWVDYLAPQLYWSTSSTGQNFGALLGWWAQQNTMRRHLWPGLASYRVVDGTASAFGAGEIGAQLDLVRAQSGTAGGATGVLFYNASSVRSDRGGFVTALKAQQYAGLALPPATTWLDAAPPSAPTLQVVRGGSGVTATLGGVPDARWWLVRWRIGGANWQSQLVPASTTSVPIAATALDGIVAMAVDAVGNVSAGTVWRP